MARNGNSKGMKETKFKDTELGKIPEEWDYGKFEDYLDKFSAGATPYRGIASNFIGTIPWVSSGELNYNYITDTREHISQDAQKSTHLTLHPKGTFLIAITGLEAAGTRGRCAFIETPATTNQSCLAIYSTEKMIVEYLFWFYQQWSDYLAFNFSQGSKQQSFTAEIVKKLPIYAPSLSEQQRIASALFDADALVAELDALIEKKRAIMAGTMQELLTGKRRLKGFSEPWSEEVLRNHLSFLPGFPFTSDRFSKVACGPRLIRNRDLHSDHQVIYYTGEYSNQYIIEDGDLLIGMDGDFTPCLWNKGNAVLNQRVGRIICKNTANIVFLYYLLQKPLAELQESTGATTVKHLSHSTIENMVCRMPKLAEQHAIATILSDMDAEIAELEAKRDKYKEVRQGMMQQLLTGKIRLI